MKGKYFVLAAIILGVVAGVTYAAFFAAPQVVAYGDNVTVYYTGALPNGTVFGSNFNGQPLQFTVGANQVIQGFQNGVMGMKLNETKTITVPMAEAYGPVNPSLIVNIPMNAFGNQTILPGMTIVESGNGVQSSGVVKSENKTFAIVDFNPPLAGYNLTFTIRVVQIQK